MPYDPTMHHRRSIRLKGFDYSQPGAYFVTVGIRGRLRLFGKVENQTICNNEAGNMIATLWESLPQRFPALGIDLYVVMPDHFHGILVLKDSSSIIGLGLQDNASQSSEYTSRPRGTLPGTVGRIMQAFKSISTHSYIEGVAQWGWPPFLGKLWERNYYERVIRDDAALAAIRTYILENPKRWSMRPKRSNIEYKN